MTTTLAPATVVRQWDNNGNPLVNGQLFTYAAGTTTPIPTYTDSTGLFQNTNPVTLNSRGEASVWLQPNVAYKFIWQDSAGNQIGPAVDQIVNSQLITLYGGVDSGIANAYVLNFTSNFTSYTDGIVIFWIPSNANTGPSTININGLGVIALVNQNGSPLVAGQVSPNQVASLMIKGGQALLINNTVATSVLAVSGTNVAPPIAFQADPTTGFYWPGAAGQIGLSLAGVASGVISTGIALFTITGITGSPTLNCPYFTNGLSVLMRIPQTNGVSNATTFSMSSIAGAILPAPNFTQWVTVQAMEDNGSPLLMQLASVAATGLLHNNTTFTFWKNGSAGGWTGSGTKGIGDGTSGNYVTVIYSLI